MSYNHRMSDRTRDGRIELPAILIPDRDVTAGMALMEGSEKFEMGIPGSTDLPVHWRRVPSFYIDPTEFTYNDYLQVSERLPQTFNERPVSEDSAASVNYDEAVGFAEQVGKRLPTEAEFEYAATMRGQHRFPWGDQFPAAAQPTEFGSVRTPAFDRLAADPPVFGLCSNKAEWTAWVAFFDADALTSQGTNWSDYRPVRGGDLATVNGDPALNAEARDPRKRWLVLRHQEGLGVGFRGVRSAAPVLSP